MSFSCWSLRPHICHVQVIVTQLERHKDDNACLAYWLTNNVTLLYLLHCNMEPASDIVARPAAAWHRATTPESLGRQPLEGGCTA